MNDEERKVPYLGDVPFLGWLFKTRLYTSNKRELLIILTPHVVYSEADAQRVKDQEAQRMDWILENVEKLQGPIGLTPPPEQMEPGFEESGPIEEYADPGVMQTVPVEPLDSNVERDFDRGYDAESAMPVDPPNDAPPPRRATDDRRADEPEPTESIPRDPRLERTLPRRDAPPPRGVKPPLIPFPEEESIPDRRSADPGRGAAARPTRPAPRDAAPIRNASATQPLDRPAVAPPPAVGAPPGRRPPPIVVPVELPEHYRVEPTKKSKTGGLFPAKKPTAKPARPAESDAHAKKGFFHIMKPIRGEK